MSNYDYFCKLPFTVFVILVKIFIISSQSLFIDSYSLSLKHPFV